MAARCGPALPVQGEGSLRPEERDRERVSFQGKAREGLSVVHGRPLEAAGSVRPQAGPPSWGTQTQGGLGHRTPRGTGPEDPLQQHGAPSNATRHPPVSRQRTAASWSRGAL